MPHLTARKRARLTELQRKLSAHVDRTVGTAPQSNLAGPADQSSKDELDELVASECVYCGDVMIRYLMGVTFLSPPQLVPVFSQQRAVCYKECEV